MKKIGILIFTFGIFFLIFFFRIQMKEAAFSFLKPSLPQPQAVHEFTKISAPSTLYHLPSTINLKIPFAPQAPFANWGLPYQEACEEAAVIMAHRFFTGQKLTTKIMDEEILKLVEWEKKTFGYYEDTNAQEIARILREYFGYLGVEVRYTFTVEDIKREIAKGHPVIVPAAGRLLPNPYFRRPGPIYHALVIKGYTKTKIITNDPGTRRGADFLYDPQALMNALHEWNPKNILDGRKAMIVVKN